MMHSLNEIELLVRKATRGCGLPWGVADEAGKAIRWLHALGLDGISALASVLESYDHQNLIDLSPQHLDGVWQAPAGVLSPLMVGASLCDCMDTFLLQQVKTTRIAHPVLVAGFLGQTALDEDRSVRISWAGVQLELHRNELAITGNHEHLGLSICEELACRRAPISNEASSIAPLIGSVSVNEGNWEILEEYAHHTYVPATEASRLAGAGAGLNDND
jgi:hypothetical protein